MASYNIEWKQSTKKDLRGISKGKIPKIIEAAESLAENPFPNGYVKLTGSEFTYRIRVRNYRIIYEVHDKEILILIVKVGHRKDVYQRMR